MESVSEFTLTSDNISLPFTTFSPKENVTQGEFLAICTVLVWNGMLSVIGNFINLLVINRVKSFKRNMKIYMFLLSVTDFTTGFLLLISTVMTTFFSLESDMIFCILSGFLLALSPFLSGVCLFNIAMDKFVSIHYPFRYHKFSKVPHIYAFQSLVGGTAVLLWVSHVDGKMFQNIPYVPLYGICLINFRNRKKTVSIMVAALSGMGVQLVGITFMYLRIAVTAWQQGTRINKMVATVNANESQLVKEWKGFVLFTVVTMAFYLTWVPFWASQFIILLTDVEFPSVIYFIGGSLTTSNSYWNPIIYTLGNEAFRAQVKRLFKIKY